MTALPSEKDVVSEEHWTKKGDDVKLFLWEKYIGSPPKGPGGKKGTVLCVHGSSMASTPTFDLHVEGLPVSSAMNYFAYQGYDHWRSEESRVGKEGVSTVRSRV